MNSGGQHDFIRPLTIFPPLIRHTSYGKAESLDSGSIDIRRTEAIEVTVNTERIRLLDFIRRRIRNESDAEDILQDVFLQLAASYSVTEPIENLTAWLFTVARNKLTDWYRKHRAAPSPKYPSDGDRGGPMNPEEFLFNPQDEPDRAYWRSTVWSELADALEEIPEEQREVFVWHEL